MSATVITTETFPSNTPKPVIDGEIALRIKAGAIRSWVDKTAPKWTVKTEWNVFGQND